MRSCSDLWSCFTEAISRACRRTEEDSFAFIKLSCVASWLFRASFSELISFFKAFKEEFKAARATAGEKTGWKSLGSRSCGLCVSLRTMAICVTRRGTTGRSKRGSRSTIQKPGTAISDVPRIRSARTGHPRWQMKSCGSSAHSPKTLWGP